MIPLARVDDVRRVERLIAGATERLPAETQIHETADRWR